jgi:hypothetical protein
MSGTVLPKTMWKASMLSTGARSSPSIPANAEEQFMANREP